MRSRRRIGLAAAAALSLLLGPVTASTAHAVNPPAAITITSISPNQISNPTVAPIHITGTGMTADDTIVDSSPLQNVTFSQVTSDGNGGLDAIVTDQGSGISNDTVEVTSADRQQSAACQQCLSTIDGTPLQFLEYFPGDHSLRLEWGSSPGATSTVITWTPPGGATATESVTGTSTTLTGLDNGTLYAVTIADEETSSAGVTVEEASEFTEEVGVVPDPPTLTGSHPCCGFDQATASGQTWEPFGATYTFTFTARNGLLPPQVDQGSGSEQFFQDDSRAGVTVTATATNSVGTSAPSKPIIIEPMTNATAIRHESYRYTHGKLRLSWQPPAHDGHSPISHYRVLVMRGHHSTVLTTTQLHATLAMRAGAHFSTDIRAINEAGPSAEMMDSFRSIGSASVDVVTALDRHGRAKWRYDDQGGWHSLGGHFAAPPAPFVRPGSVLTFVGADKAGHAMIRSLSTPWRSLTDTPCFAPTAIHSAMGMTVACRAADGTLEFSIRTPNHNGLPFVHQSDWTTTDLHIVGGPQAGGGLRQSGLLVVRTAPWDHAGDDVRSYDTIHDGDDPLRFGRIRLACTGPVESSQLWGAALGCSTGSHTFAWRNKLLSRHGTITTPYRIAGPVAVTASNGGVDGRAAITDPHGNVHVVDLLNGQHWTLTAAPTPGLRGTCVKGCS
jgi:hypothetical protein